MQTCCFCFDLRSGSIASGIFTLVVNIKALIGSIIALVLLLEAVENKEHSATSYPPISYQTLKFHKAILGCAIVTCSLMSFFSVLLLIGVQKGFRRLFLPWSAVIGVQIGVCLVALCMTIPILGTGLCPVLITVGALIGGVFCVYMLWCVNAYYKLLSTVKITTVPCEGSPVHYHPVQSKDEIPYKLEKDAKLFP